VIAVVAQLVQPTAAELAEVAEVFDQYRHHYGEPALPGQTLAWLAQHTSSGVLTIFTAHTGEELTGIATAVTVPASLRLGCFWQLRDLYVVPAARRHGTGRALVSAVRAAAATAGALRVSVQTETGNAAALTLYHASGFRPVEGLQILSLDLPPACRRCP
jgi:GNAT superfamily N-acetyltransferase